MRNWTNEGAGGECPIYSDLPSWILEAMGCKVRCPECGAEFYEYGDPDLPLRILEATGCKVRCPECGTEFYCHNCFLGYCHNEETLDP